MRPVQRQTTHHRLVLPVLDQLELQMDQRLPVLGQLALQMDQRLQGLDRPVSFPVRQINRCLVLRLRELRLPEQDPRVRDLLGQVRWHYQMGCPLVALQGPVRSFQMDQQVLFRPAEYQPFPLYPTGSTRSSPTRWAQVLPLAMDQRCEECRSEVPLLVPNPVGQTFLLGEELLAEQPFLRGPFLPERAQWRVLLEHRNIQPWGQPTFQLHNILAQLVPLRTDCHNNPQPQVDKTG